MQKRRRFRSRWRRGLHDSSFGQGRRTFLPSFSRFSFDPYADYEADRESDERALPTGDAAEEHRSDDSNQPTHESECLPELALEVTGRVEPASDRFFEAGVFAADSRQHRGSTHIGNFD